MKFKVVIEHESSSRSVGYVEAESAKEAREVALHADWSRWHTEDEISIDVVASVTALIPTP